MDNTLELIDSRDVTTRIEELLNSFTWTLSEATELRALRELDKLGSEYGEDWEYGCPIIRHSYFVEYIKSHYGEVYGIELENMPDVFRNAIDWNAVAERAMIDYTEITFDDETYYVRTKH
jgi:hypothetical protein